MKISNSFCLLFLLILASSCSRVEDSILKPSDYEVYLNYDEASEKKSISSNLEFWAQKLEKAPNQTPYHLKLAAIYSQLFTKTGDIAQLKYAEQHFILANEQTNYTNASYLRSLAYNYISQHQFKKALNLLEIAETNGEKLSATQKMLFDVHLELGNDKLAQEYLDKIKDFNEFDYLIRLSKWNDHRGDLKVAINFMEQALQKAESGNTEQLKIWAFTNLADFYGHNGEVKKAYELYLRALELDPNNSYSKKAIAWIAYSHDNNPEEAIRILDKVSDTYISPDYYLFRAELAEYVSNEKDKTENIKAYLNMVDSERYGEMYNVHTALLYADEFNEPQLSIEIAQKEVDNRPTTLSYDLLAWAYYNAGNLEKAKNITEKYVVNKTFDPTALYHMATIYRAVGNDEDAEKMKKELLSSSFELGPVMIQKIALL